MVKTGNKRIIMGSFLGDWKGYHKSDGDFYPVMGTDTVYILNLSENIFSVMSALTKGFNVTPEK